MKDVKCPVCGWNYSEAVGDPADYVKMRLHLYSPKTKRLLKDVARLINNTLPSQDLLALRNFLVRLDNEDTEEQAIRRGIAAYMAGKYINQGKGFAYLHAIIKSQNKDNTKLKDLERKLIGSGPKEYEK